LEKSRQPLDLPKKQGGYGRVGSSSSRSREPWDRGSVTHQPSDLIGVAQELPSGFEGSVVPVVEGLSTFETPKPGEDLGRPSVRHVAEIEASGVREIRSPVDRRSGKSIVETPA
jgi:hypothetical protein